MGEAARITTRTFTSPSTPWGGQVACTQIISPWGMCVSRGPKAVHVSTKWHTSVARQWVTRPRRRRCWRGTNWRPWAPGREFITAYSRCSWAVLIPARNADIHTRMHDQRGRRRTSLGWGAGGGVSAASAFFQGPIGVAVRTSEPPRAAIFMPREALSRRPVVLLSKNPVGWRRSELSTRATTRCPRTQQSDPTQDARGGLWPLQSCYCPRACGQMAGDRTSDRWAIHASHYYTQHLRPHARRAGRADLYRAVTAHALAVRW